MVSIRIVEMFKKLVSRRIACLLDPLPVPYLIINHVRGNAELIGYFIGLLPVLFHLNNAFDGRQKLSGKRSIRSLPHRMMESIYHGPRLILVAYGSADCARKSEVIRACSDSSRLSVTALIVQVNVRVAIGLGNQREHSGLGRVAPYAILKVTATENAPPVGGKARRQVNRGNRYAVPVAASPVVEETTRVPGGHVHAELAQRRAFRS